MQDGGLGPSSCHRKYRMENLLRSIMRGVDMDEKVMVVLELTGSGLCVVEKVIDNELRYAAIKVGEPLSSIKTWQGRWLRASALWKGRYEELVFPIPYEEYAMRKSSSTRDDYAKRAVVAFVKREDILMEGNGSVIELKEYKFQKNILDEERIREFANYCEVLVVRDYEYKYSNYTTHVFPLESIFVHAVECKKELIHVSIEFPKQLFSLRCIATWLEEYKVCIVSRDEQLDFIANTEEIVAGLNYKGNSVLLCKKGTDAPPYNREDYEEITESWQRVPQMIDTGKSKSVSSMEQQMRTIVNGRAAVGVPHIEAELIVSNGTIILADYIDDYYGHVGFYTNDNPSAPVAYLFDYETTVYIDTLSRTDGSKACIVEHRYFIENL